MISFMACGHPAPISLFPVTTSWGSAPPHTGPQGPGILVPSCERLLKPDIPLDSGDIGL